MRDDRVDDVLRDPVRQPRLSMHRADRRGLGWSGIRHNAV
jgi:hypothetical protein